MANISTTPRFHEESAWKKHWPLAWMLLVGIIVFSFVAPDVQRLGRMFEDRTGATIHFRTGYIFPNTTERRIFSQEIKLNSVPDPRYRHETSPTDETAREFAGTLIQRSSVGYMGSPPSVDTEPFLRWIFHRRVGLFLVREHDLHGALREFTIARQIGATLGNAYPYEAFSLADLALLSQLKANEMGQVANWLFNVVLPIFSFLSALLPFFLFMHFIKSRDRQESVTSGTEGGGARLLLKTVMLSSWFAVVVTGWAAMRNYGMGLIHSGNDPVLLSCLGSLGLLFVSCVLMLRYMPPYRMLSLKRTLVGFGFGGVMVLAKAWAIYWALCLSLAGHPALKEALFNNSMINSENFRSRTYAAQAIAAAKTSMASRVYQKEELEREMNLILVPDKTIEKVPQVRHEQLLEELDSHTNDNVAVSGMPYFWDTEVTSPRDASGVFGSDDNHKQTPGNTLLMAAKIALAYILLFCPEGFAYAFLPFRKFDISKRSFENAIRIKEYFFGVDHWLVVTTLELYGSFLIMVKRQVGTSHLGESFLNEAIVRYERSRGRHDQMTIAAKMALAQTCIDSGDDRRAERILNEALRDVGKDFDVLAYCELLSEIGKLYSKRGNYSRAKQTYKQVIDLLEQKLVKAPPSRGLVAWIRNIYATIPSWQLQLRLVQAYLDLAEVFHLAKYNGEAQRLTEDANRLMNVYEKDMVVVNEIATVYLRGKIAQAKILQTQGRFDECFKLLAAASKQTCRWGHGRSLLYFDFIVAQCEVELDCSKGMPNYFEMARNDYLAGKSRFGFDLMARPEMLERWAKVGAAFGITHVYRTRIFTEAPVKKEAEPAVELAKAQPTYGEYGTANVSQFMLESKANQEESIVLRWQREHREEKELEKVPVKRQA